MTQELTTISAAASQEPFVGPRPFEREDRDRFFGRERETEDLVSLVIANRTVVLYAQYGAGKTSLVNAKLIPRLEEKEGEGKEGEGFQVLPSARVGGFPPPGLDPREIKNLYGLNVMMTWRQRPTKAVEQGSVGNAGESLEPDVLGHLAQTSLADFLAAYPRPKDQEGSPTPRLLAFDQVEELFILYPDRRPERKRFLEQIQEALERDRLLRVLLVMREDYIAHLDTYVDLFPEKLRIRYRMHGLTKNDAISAVKEPRDDRERHFSQGAAHRLVSYLLTIRAETSSGRVEQIPGEFVEPVQLQLVCREIWRHLRAGDVELGKQDREISESDAEISEQDLQPYLDTADEALTRYYEEGIRKVAELGTAEERLRGWFDERLITSQGTRGMVFRDALATGGLPNRDVDELEGWHLVRTEMRVGTRWCELAHDLFIEPIRNANRRWREARDAGQTTERARVRKFIEEASGVLAEVERLSQESSPESYRAIADTALKWQIVFSSFAKASRPVPLWSMPAKKPRGEEEARKWFDERSYLQSTIRKMSTLLRRSDQSIEGLLSMADSTEDEMEQDRITTRLVFALEVLEGGIDLARDLGPTSYWRLEREWLSEVKRTKAHLMWESRAEKQTERGHWNHEDYYFEVCRQLRAMLTARDRKAGAESFEFVREYIRDRYLDADGNFDPGKEESEKLLDAKASRIFKVGAGQGAAVDWRHASTYARMFYANVIPAVEGKDEERTLLVLKAFQYSKAIANRFLITNCFEAAIAIYFLDAEVIEGLWNAAVGDGGQSSYTEAAAATPGWRNDWVPPGELRDRLAFDPATSRLVLRGVLTECDLKFLLDELPPNAEEHRSAVRELFRKSRLLPEHTTF
jgi:hypothetical protein